jgi:hypothetical protein
MVNGLNDATIIRVTKTIRLMKRRSQSHASFHINEKYKKERERERHTHTHTHTHARTHTHTYLGFRVCTSCAWFRVPSHETEEKHFRQRVSQQDLVTSN